MRVSPYAAATVDRTGTWVRECLREALPSCAVDQHDDNSEAAMHDLTITHPDGTIGAVEVTAAADRQQLELWKLVGGRGKRWIESGIAGGWIVRILPSTRAKNLLRQLPGLLRDLERAGLRDIRGDKTSADQPSALAGQLSIIQAFQVTTDYPGSIYLMPPERLAQMGGYSPVTGNPLARWLSEWIPDPSRAGNLRKLARSGAPGRHLFVLVPGFNPAPFAVNDLLTAPRAPLPTIPPTLPAQSDRWSLDGEIQHTRTKPGPMLPDSARPSQTSPDTRAALTAAAGPGATPSDETLLHGIQTVRARIPVTRWSRAKSKPCGS